ncbi:MAG TPA: Tol-Pal system beta propeller repeat protein TolB [Saliniramus sp.]|nr:Tol-Pal system beta propeller repeat protein TolB [Saliniramus sp.]
MASTARAELVIDVRGGQFTPMPIAVTQFTGDGNLGMEVTGIIENNLRRSGYFAPVATTSFPDRAPAFDAAPQFEAWRNAGVQGLVTGRVTREAGGRIKAEFRLWDIASGTQITGQQYFTDPNNWRRIAHIISDAVFTRITGVGGFFDTRIVFIDESGPKEDRRKRLAIMDQDGANVRYLTPGDNSVVTPRFSPLSQEIAFMAQQRGEQPRVQVLDIETGARQAVGNFPDMTSSPRFSPDGQSIVMALQQGGNANLYEIDLVSRTTTRLTSTGAIDTSPSFSPDATRIVFESDRGGRQQLYVMNANGSDPQRISFGEGAYSQPVWSPRGDLIAFTKFNAGRFAIGVMRPDGSGERVLTEGFHNESPAFSPNGQYIVFFRDPGGQSGGQLFMVDITGRVEVAIPTPGFASDPTWSPLLSEAR